MRTLFLFAFMAVCFCSLRAFDVKNLRVLMNSYLSTIGANSTNATACLTPYHAHLWEAATKVMLRMNWNSTSRVAGVFGLFTNATVIAFQTMAKCDNSSYIANFANELTAKLWNSTWYYQRVNDTLPQLKSGLKAYVSEWTKKHFAPAGMIAANVTQAFFFFSSNYTCANCTNATVVYA